MHTTSCEVAAALPEHTGESASSSVISRATSLACFYKSLIAGVLLSIGSMGARAEAGDPADMSLERPMQKKSGSLVIAGGGDLPPEIRLRFVELAGGKNAKIVIVPTASADADNPGWKPSFVSDTLREQVQSVDFFHTRDPVVANDDKATSVLDDATGLWFGGGDQKQLVHYRQTKAHEKFWNILKRGGVVGGTSAGAAIMSGPMIAGGKTDPVINEGLNFLPGTVVDQHFRKRNRGDRLSNALKLYPTHIGLGVDEGTALVVHPSGARVIGASTVSVYHPDGRIRQHKDGDEIQLLPLTISSLGADAR